MTATGPAHPVDASDARQDPPSRRLPTAFRILYLGEALSLFGTQVSLVVVPLIATLSLGSGEFSVGLLSATGWLPIVLFGLVAGALIDRVSRWRVMLVCNLVRLAAFAAVPLIALGGGLSIQTLLVVAFIAGIANVFFDIAYQTFVPSVVREDQLSTANSRLELCRSAAQLLGPLIGGALAARFDPAYVVAIDAVTFLIAALALLVLPFAVHRGARQRLVAAMPGPQHGKDSLRDDLRAGLQAVWRSIPLRTLVASGALLNIFVAGINALLVLYVTRELHLGSVALGIALAAAGVGALLGAGTYRHWSQRWAEGGSVRAGLTFMAVGAVILPMADVAPAPLATLIVAEALMGYGTPIVNIALVTLRQKITPPELLGRVNASARVAIMSSLPLGALLFGSVAEVTGMQAALTIAAIGQVVVVVVMGPPLGRIDSHHREG